MTAEVASIWRPIDTANPVLGQRAKLKLRDGRVITAVWDERGVAQAWFPDPGQIKDRWLGLLDPAEWWPLGRHSGRAE